MESKKDLEQNKVLETYIYKNSSVSQDGRLFEMFTPGISIADFDRSGNMWLPSISMYFFMLRVFVMSRPEYCVSSARSPHHRYFIVQMSYKVSEKFYELTRNRGVYFAMKLTSRLLSISKSSIITYATIQDPDDPNHSTLASATYKQTHVNFASRRSSPINKGWVSKHAELVDAPTDTVSLTVPSDIPEHAESITTVIRYSDTDYNQHLNNTKYLVICIDCINAACVKRTLRGFDEDICKRFIKSADCSYLRECRMGDEVACSVWQDEHGDDNTLHAIITKNGVKVFYSVIKFYPEKAIAKL